jgi:hypothetical protein
MKWTSESFVYTKKSKKNADGILPVDLRIVSAQISGPQGEKSEEEKDWYAHVCSDSLPALTTISFKGSECTMKCARDKFVNQFFDIKATVGDRDEEEDEDENDGDDGMSAQFFTVPVPLQWLLGFVQDDPIIDTQYDPQRHSVEAEDGGWVDLVVSLEKRYASTHCVAEGDRNERPLDPTIASFIDKNTRLPTNDDYPLWRVRCKVFLTSILFWHAHTFV